MSKLQEQLNKPLQVKDTRTLTGPFAVLDVFNQNNRRYPSDVYEEAYAELEPKIKDRRLLGELDHPIDYDEIRLSNVSHVITECHIGKGKSGNRVVYGTVVLLDTPAGKIAQALVTAGIPLGISSRGVGNTKQVSEGLDVTQFKLITYDLVAEPSFKSAVLSKPQENALAESLDMIESKLPLNESLGEGSLRKSIKNIRESLRLPETRVHIDPQQFKTMEVAALQSLIESKNNKLKEMDAKLKKIQEHCGNKIQNLRSELKESDSRYTSLNENHQKLQDSYNKLRKSREIEESTRMKEKEAEIIDLRKRLAVEQRGMSYNQVEELLEGLSTPKEISDRLNSITSMNRRSTPLLEEDLTSIKESLSESAVNSKSSRLSRVIAKV